MKKQKMFLAQQEMEEELTEIPDANKRKWACDMKMKKYLWKYNLNMKYNTADPARVLLFPIDLFKQLFELLLLFIYSNIFEYLPCKTTFTNVCQ